MAITVTLGRRVKTYSGYMIAANVLLDNSYPTGGYSLSPSQFGLASLDMVLPAPAGGYMFEYDHTNQKLKAYMPTVVAIAGTAGEAGVNNTIIRTSATAIGVSGTGQAATVRNAASEVPNGTNLSAVTTRVLAFGY